MKHSEALKNSFAAVKRDIDEIKARNSLIDTKLKNSFSNFKKDMDFLKKSVKEIKAERRNFIGLDHLDDRLSKIDASIEDIKDSFSKDIKRLEKYSKEGIKEKPVIKKTSVKSSKEEGKKGFFDKVIDFFAED